MPLSALATPIVSSYSSYLTIFFLSSGLIANALNSNFFRASVVSITCKHLSLTISFERVDFN
jgi:hypothetical protein